MFVYKNHTIGYYVAIFDQVLDFFTSFTFVAQLICSLWQEKCLVSRKTHS